MNNVIDLLKDTVEFLFPDLPSTARAGLLNQLCHRINWNTQLIAPSADLPKFYIGGPYHDGTYSVCETATGQVLRKFKTGEDLRLAAGVEEQRIGLETIRVTAVGTLHDSPSTETSTSQLKATPMSNEFQAEAAAKSEDLDRDPLSWNSQVAGMNPGDTLARCRAVDPTMTMARLPDELPAIRTQVRNACNPAVTRAKARVGGTYTVEVGDVVMPSGAMYVVAVVTKVN